MIRALFVRLTALAFCFVLTEGVAGAVQPKYNVLFIISDDLTATALSCYGNQVCKTPNIDRLAAGGVRFTRAYCQGTYCGPSRASFMSGYYPHAIGMLGYGSPRKAIGGRATWAQHFKQADCYTARVSKIFHMGVPGGIEAGTDGADDPASWTERFNSPDRNGRRPATARRWKATPTASGRWSAATHSSSSRPTATTWCIPTARPLRRPAV